MPPFVWIMLLAILFFAMLVIVIISVRTLSARPVQYPVEKVDLAKINGLDLAANLAEVIQCKTLSITGTNSADGSAFRELHEILKKNYPLVHNHLLLEKINEYSLLFQWQGSQPDLQPVLFSAHQDVVPVDDSSLEQWPYPPFSGAIAEGYVWGRGTLDIKCQMIALLDAVEHLLGLGFQPKRTILLAFGHDEEIGGFRGAAAIAKTLKERGIRLAAMIDEGGGVVEGAFPGIEKPIALVGTAEKGSLVLKISAKSPPGHSSAPPPHTSIGILAQGLTRLEAKPLPASLAHARPILQALAPHTSLPLRMVLTNLWLFGGLVQRTMARTPQTNALLRTTTAITMIEGGIKTNILPPNASARVNYRLAPGDNLETVIEHTRRAIAEPKLKISRPSAGGRNASPVSPTDSPAFTLLASVIRQIFRDVPVTPFLVTGATDARHYTSLCQNIYRFSPLLATRDDMGRVHGIAECISIQNLENMLQFFIRLIQVWGDRFLV